MTKTSSAAAPARENKIIREDVQSIAQDLAKPLAALAGTTLLVTGGSGFLCSYVLDTIAYLNDEVFDDPCRVISVDNLRSGIAGRVAHLANRSNFSFLHHDVSEPLAFDGPVDWILHGAGIASPTFYRKYPLETVDVNVSGTRRMLELARSQNARSILYISTSEIYGDPEPQFIPTSESYRGSVSCTGPRACYDESKRMAETLCAIYHNLYATPVKVVRPFNVYGPGQRLDDQRVVPDLISASLERRPLILYSDGRATRSFCYVSDFIRALLLILLSSANGEAFNVGNDEREISMVDFAREVSHAAGPPALEVIYQSSKDPQYLTDNPQRRCPDLTKIRSHFDWTPKVGLSDGISRTLLSYRHSGQQSGSPVPEASQRGLVKGERA